MKVKIETWTRNKAARRVTRFLERPAFDDAAEESARHVLKAIRAKGNAAIFPDLKIETPYVVVKLQRGEAR